MAVGDVVSGIGAAATILDFQPAAGVECVITYVSSTAQAGNQHAAHVYDGTNQDTGVFYSDANLVYTGPIKIFINNTNYLRLTAPPAGLKASYTGVQTK